MRGRARHVETHRQLTLCSSKDERGEAHTQGKERHLQSVGLRLGEERVVGEGGLILLSSHILGKQVARTTDVGLLTQVKDYSKKKMHVSLREG